MTSHNREPSEYRQPMTAFLTARWTNLCLLNYAVPPSALEPHLPRGLSLDTHEGEAFISLVAFDFLDTRVLGIPWPGYRNFPEINLRFYARQGDRRGVVFIREWVPILSQKVMAHRAPPSANPKCAV